MTEPKEADMGVARIMSGTPLPAPPPPEPDAIRVIEALLDKRPLPADLQARLLDTDAANERRVREAQQREDDWPALARYRTANADVRDPELVMIGDSITEIWRIAMPDMFSGATVNRGIAGQTSPQILLRFMADVVALNPRHVHILCGTNDIAGNTGPNMPEDYQRNIRAMTDIATANGIGVLIGSIPPAGQIFWQPEARPLEWVPRLNAWLRDFADRRTIPFIDYYAALDDGHGSLRGCFAADGVHVTRAAYHVMRDVLEKALA